jgi:hypothetical protein
VPVAHQPGLLPVLPVPPLQWLRREAIRLFLAD